MSLPSQTVIVVPRRMRPGVYRALRGAGFNRRGCLRIMWYGGELRIQAVDE